jgi:hypothetical protein
MSSPSWVRRLLPLELMLIRRMAFLGKVPMLWRLRRQITARLTLMGRGPAAAPAFRLDFETPYLRLPVEVDRGQVGAYEPGSGFRPAAFRFFDWRSWMHIEGRIEWHGRRDAALGGGEVTLITGFTYRPGDLPEGAGNLGLRIAEGVHGALRVLWGDAVVPVAFEPGYWMLEPGNDGYRVVAIRDNTLMVLIVSLSEIGSGKEATYAKSVDHLWQWVGFHCGRLDPESAMVRLLRYVREWGPLGMSPLYRGLVEILDRLQVPDKERILFDFFADQVGVRDNRDGRLLAVRTLEALGTDASQAALREILSYVRHRGLEPAEIALIQAAAGEADRMAEEGEGKIRSSGLPLHPLPAK